MQGLDTWHHGNKVQFIWFQIFGYDFYKEAKILLKTPNTVAKNFHFQFKSGMPSLFWPGQLTELSPAWVAWACAGWNSALLSLQLTASISLVDSTGSLSDWSGGNVITQPLDLKYWKYLATVFDAYVLLVISSPFSLAEILTVHFVGCNQAKIFLLGYNQGISYGYNFITMKKSALFFQYQSRFG